MTFDDTLRDGSSVGKPCISLTAHLPLKFMLNSSFFTFTGDFKAYSQILKSIIVLHLVFSLAGSTNISTRVSIYPWFIVNKHSVNIFADE